MVPRTSGQEGTTSPPGRGATGPAARLSTRAPGPGTTAPETGPSSESRREARGPVVRPSSGPGRGPGPVVRPAPAPGCGSAGLLIRPVPDPGRGSAGPVVGPVFDSGSGSGPVVRPAPASRGGIQGSGTCGSGRRVQVPGAGERGTAGPGARRGSPGPDMGLLPGFRRGSGLTGAELGARSPGAGVGVPGGPDLADAEPAGTEFTGTALACAGLAARSAWPREAGLTNDRARPVFAMRFYPPGAGAGALLQ